jgi:Fur family ferric uptake transcriptional regulator
MHIDLQAILTKHQLKQTAPRLMVLNEIITQEAAVSQPELEKKLGSKVDRVTLYRTLSTFEEKGILHKIMDAAGTANFAICKANCTAAHHHDEHLHFNCGNCKKVYCLDVKVPTTTIPKGFTMHTLQLMATGICDNCNSISPISN